MEGFGIQAAEVDPGELVGSVAQPDETPHTVFRDAAEQILALLRRARQPLLVVGQGVRIAGAAQVFQEFVHKLGAPVIASRLKSHPVPATSWLDGFRQSAKLSDVRISGVVSATSALGWRRRA